MVSANWLRKRNQLIQMGKMLQSHGGPLAHFGAVISNPKNYAVSKNHHQRNIGDFFNDIGHGVDTFFNKTVPDAIGWTAHTVGNITSSVVGGAGTIVRSNTKAAVGTVGGLVKDNAKPIGSAISDIFGGLGLNLNLVLIGVAVVGVIILVK